MTALVAVAALLIGAAGQLGITSPLWLQYLRISPAEVGQGRQPLWLALTAAQAVMVFVVAWRHRAAVKDALGAVRLRPFAWLLAAALFVACAAHVTRYVGKAHFAVPSYVAQVAATAIIFALNLLNVLAIAAAVPDSVARAARDRFHGLSARPAVPWILASLGLAISLALAFVALDRVPHIPDEIAYVFQAECFARGALFGEAPANPDAFRTYLVPAEGGRWFAVTPPGWPAVLAAGAALGAPWIVNPVLGALAIVLAHALTRRLAGPRAALAVACLLTFSPWLLYLSASYMTHALTLVLALGAWLALARARDARPVAWGLLAGALLGWMALVRQLDAVLFAGVTALWMLGLGGPRARVATMIACAGACAAVAALILPYNAAMTGNPWTFPINAYLDAIWYPGANRLGFGADVGNPPGGWGDLDPFPGHGARDVLVNTNQNLYAMNFELFGWGIGSLFFAAVHVLAGRKTALDRLMLAWVLILLLGYHLYWFSGGPDFGARYWYLMIYPLVVLTARGIESAAPEPGGRLGVAVAALVLCAVVVFIPWRALTRYRDYRGFHDDYRKLDLPAGALVLVDAPGIADYSSAFILNSPLPDASRAVFARDLGPDLNQRMIAANPDRPVVYVRGRSAGDGPTRVVSGTPARPR